MKGLRRTSLASAGLLLLVLSGCAAGPEVDLDEAQAWLDEVIAAESDGPGGAGSASMLIDGDASGHDGGVTLDFDNPVPLVRGDARCFGGGTADVTVTVEAAEGDSSDSYDAEIPCDREAHSIPLDPAVPASAATVAGHGSARTYLHVTLIQEMVVER